MWINSLTPGIKLTVHNLTAVKEKRRYDAGSLVSGLLQSQRASGCLVCCSVCVWWSAFSRRCWGPAGCTVAENLRQVLRGCSPAALWSTGSVPGPESSLLTTGCREWTCQGQHGSAPCQQQQQAWVWIMTAFQTTAVHESACAKLPKAKFSGLSSFRANFRFNSGLST